MDFLKQRMRYSIHTTSHNHHRAIAETFSSNSSYHNKDHHIPSQFKTTKAVQFERFNPNFPIRICLCLSTIIRHKYFSINFDVLRPIPQQWKHFSQGAPDLLHNMSSSTST